MNAVVVESAPQAPPVSEAGALIQAIERAALNPQVDVEKMERLLAMQERILTRNAETAFNASMRAAQEEMPKVLRNKRNDQTSSNYADLEKVNEIIVPVYTKHGFSLSFGTGDTQTPGHIRITCLVSHVDGHSRPYFCDMPLDLAGIKGNQNKTATHAHGSTMSYGRRYLTLLIFNVTLTNEDRDGNQPGDTINEDQIANLQALIEEVKADKAKFLKFLRVGDLADLAANRYSAAVKALEAKRAQ